MADFSLIEDRAPWHRGIINGLVILIVPTIISISLLMVIAPSLGKVADYVVLAPVFPCPLILGLLLGIKHALDHEKHPNFLYWLWLLPFSLFIANHVFHGGISQVELFRNEFTNDTDDEGLTQIFAVSPMIGSIGYALGRFVMLRRSLPKTLHRLKP